jgi:hypothetical protein
MNVRCRVLPILLLLATGLVPAGSADAKPAVRVHVHAEVEVNGSASSGSYSVYMWATLSRKVSDAKGQKLETQYRPRGKTRLKIGKKTYRGGHYQKGTYDASSRLISWYGSTVNKNLFKQVGKKGTLRFTTRLGKRHLRVPVKRVVAE